MNIKALGKRVVLEKIKTERVTKSNILLVESPKENENFAKVLSFSDEVKGLNKGDKVLFNIEKSMEVKHLDNVYYIIDIEDIWAVIGGENE